MDDKDVRLMIGVASTVTVAFLNPVEAMAEIPGSKIQRIECNGGQADVVNTNQHGLAGSAYAIQAHVAVGEKEKSTQSAGYLADTYGLKPPILRQGFKTAKVFYKINTEGTSDSNLFLQLFFKNRQGRFSISRTFDEVGTRNAGGGWRVLEFKAAMEQKFNLSEANITRAAVTLFSSKSEASVTLGDITLETQQGTARPFILKGQATDCSSGLGFIGGKSDDGGKSKDGS